MSSYVNHVICVCVCVCLCVFVCATYDLLWPILTTKLWSRLGDHFLRGIYHLVVTIGHNKSYVASGRKISLAGPLDRHNPPPSTSWVTVHITTVTRQKIYDYTVIMVTTIYTPVNLLTNYHLQDILMLIIITFIQYYSYFLLINNEGI